MARAFIATELPSDAIDALARLRPPRAPGIRPVSADQIHLTLHFLGEVDLDRIAAPLERVAADAFRITLSGVGRFRSAGGASVLWVGVQASPSLVELHTALGEALAKVGFQTETRPYSPHITLARCKREASREVIQQFLDQHARFSIPDLPVTAFTLFSSAFTGEAHVHRREKTFSLNARP